MKINNEEDARIMLAEWQDMPLWVRKKKSNLAIEHLELNSMYYEQKGNDRGVARSERCIAVFREYLATLDP